MPSSLGKRKQRDEPEEMDWDTSCLDKLSAADVRQLCSTRGVDTRGKKEELKERLIEEGVFEIGEDEIEPMTIKMIQCELRLKGMDDSNARKADLIARYQGRVEDAPPKRKKARKGRKKKAGESLWCVVCVPNVWDPPKEDDGRGGEEEEEEEEDEDKPTCLVVGAFKKKAKAYERAVEYAHVILKGKASAADIKKLKKDVEKVKDNQHEERVGLAQDAIDKAFGGTDDAPFISVHKTTLG